MDQNHFSIIPPPNFLKEHKAYGLFRLLASSFHDFPLQMPESEVFLPSHLRGISQQKEGSIFVNLQSRLYHRQINWLHWGNCLKHL